MAKIDGDGDDAPNSTTSYMRTGPTTRNSHARVALATAVAHNAPYLHLLSPQISATKAAPEEHPIVQSQTFRIREALLQASAECPSAFSRARRNGPELPGAAESEQQQVCSSSFGNVMCGWQRVYIKHPNIPDMQVTHANRKRWGANDKSRGYRSTVFRGSEKLPCS